MLAGLSSCCLFNNSAHLSRNTFALSAPVWPAERADCVTSSQSASLSVVTPLSPHLPWPLSLHFTPRSLPVMKIMKQLCGSPSSYPPPFICPYLFFRLLFSLLNYTKSGRETTHMLHTMRYFNVLSKWQINHEIIMCTDTTDLLQEVETISHSCIQLYDSTVTSVHFYQQFSTNRCNTNQTFKRKSRHLYMQYILVLLVSITNSCKKWFKRCCWFCQPKQLGRLS